MLPHASWRLLSCEVSVEEIERQQSTRFNDSTRASLPSTTDSYHSKQHNEKLLSRAGRVIETPGQNEPQEYRFDGTVTLFLFFSRHISVTVVPPKEGSKRSAYITGIEYVPSSITWTNYQLMAPIVIN